MTSGDHSNGNGAKKPVMPSLPPELQGHIGRQLQDAYAELVATPVPDRFTALLQQLKSQESETKGE